MDDATDWMLDRAADSIEQPARRAAPAPLRPIVLVMSRWLLGRAGGEGAWTAGIRLVERGRLKAAAEAFADAAAGFEQRLGRQHIWTAQAIGRRAWCLDQIGQHQAAVVAYNEALAILDETGRSSDALASRLKDERSAAERAVNSAGR